MGWFLTDRPTTTHRSRGDGGGVMVVVVDAVAEVGPSV